MWIVRSVDYAPETISTASPGAQEEAKAMARRKLSLKQQLKGVRAALRSKRTPPQFRKGLEKRAEWLGQRVEQSLRKR